MRVLAILALALGASCYDGQDEDDFPHRSPVGHEFGIDGDLDPGTVGLELDLRVAEWRAGHDGELDPTYMDYVSHRVRYYVYDAPRFATPDSPTGYAVGRYDPNFAIVELAWQLSPPLAACGHELDHAVFGPGYGH